MFSLVSNESKNLNLIDTKNKKNQNSRFNQINIRM